MKRQWMNERHGSQDPALEVLTSLGYDYLSSEDVESMRSGLLSPLLIDVLKEQLMKINSYTYNGKVHRFDENIIDRAIRDLDVDLSEGLTKANEKIYHMLLYGKSYEVFLEDGNRQSFNLYYIDWNDLENNSFHVTEEFVMQRLDGRDTIRVDIVTFINGIPMGIIENKGPKVDVRQGISQCIRNQGKDYAPQLYKYVQLMMSTNKNETRYGTVNTPEKFWSLWREEDEVFLGECIEKAIKDREVTKQDQDIISLFDHERFLEMFQYFTVFDKNIKKIARYQQYFGVKRILETIEKRDEHGNRRSGVIWHTQGSGKSLTMVMLSKYIFAKYRDLNPKVVVVTDRVDLDNQIYQTFVHTSLRPNKAKTGKHLVELIEDDGADIITSLVHKFETASDYQKPVLSQDVFILVDESHRTQYGKLHNKMRKIFPNASYLGFTGTPLMKEEKNTMMRFGDLIHTYTIADAVEDQTIVPLYYEGLMVEQSVNHKAIDGALDRITRKLSDEHKKQVMQKWSSFSKVASSDQRIEMITFKINEHFRMHVKPTGFNAILATDKKVDAIRYKEHFDTLGDLRTEVVISPPDTREGHSDVDKESRRFENNFWSDMMERYGDERTYEESIKQNFVYGDVDILIVVDKLLTGFDAPLAQVLYVDKPLKEHNLLQAIARVNRLAEGKDRGLIIDFRGLLTELNAAMNVYSGAGLDKFDGRDLSGALHDSLEIIGELRQHHSNLVDIFRNIHGGNDMEVYERHLEDDELRKEFYHRLGRLRKTLNLASSLDNVYNRIEDEIKRYEKDCRFYEDLRDVVKLRYGDSIDNRDLEPQLQKLMDQHVAAEDVSMITGRVDLLDKSELQKEIARLGSPASKADAIRSRIARSIDNSYQRDPYYYKKFSEMIDETLNKYRERRISEKEYLEQMNLHLERFSNQDDIIGYPSSIKSDYHAQAFYGGINHVFEDSKFSYSTESMAKLSRNVKSVIENNVKVDWHRNVDVNNQIEQDLDDLIFEFMENNDVSLEWDKVDQLIQELKKIALERY